MGFVKVVKNKAYFKRFQVRYRRRREGKTDYRARRALIIQDKTKYDAPKYRLVVRKTNKDVIAQIVSSKISGDHVLSAAYSHELPAFGLKAGSANYAACYATGLLLARRTLTKLKLADNKDADRRQFKAVLDIGLYRTTTGARIFGVMKGAVDGGLSIPHSDKRFVGGKVETDPKKPSILRDHIFGGHVGAYLEQVIAEQKENPDEKDWQFSEYVKAGIKTKKDVEAMWTAVHKAIKADPTKTLPKKKRSSDGKPKKYNIKRLTHKERRAAVGKKIAALRKEKK